MDTLHEPARDLPVIGTFDLVVAGGGCTGVCAAVRAARRGLRVALIELGGRFGGVATRSLVNIWHRLSDLRDQRQIIAGLTAEILERLRRRGELIDRGTGPDDFFGAQFAFNPAELTLELDALVLEHPCITPFLHTRVVGAAGGDGRLDAVVVEDTGGRRALRARAFIDCSGDAILVARAGGMVASRATLQPPTTAALVAGLDAMAAANPGFDLRSAVFRDDDPGAPPKGFLWDARLPNGGDVRMVFGTRIIGVDGARAEDLTRAELEGRRQVRRMLDTLRRHHAQPLQLLALPDRIGLRDGQHARCRHRFTGEDLLAGTVLADRIGAGTYPVDIHHQGEGITFRGLDGRQLVIDGGGRHWGRWRDGRDPGHYTIPLGALQPVGWRNLLVAGRVLDADATAFAGVRVMVNCNQMGEAAAEAAALALDNGTGTDAVDAAAVRARLNAGGSVVP